MVAFLTGVSRALQFSLLIVMAFTTVVLVAGCGRSDTPGKQPGLHQNAPTAARSAAPAGVKVVYRRMLTAAVNGEYERACNEFAALGQRELAVVRNPDGTHSVSTCAAHIAAASGLIPTPDDASDIIVRTEGNLATFHSRLPSAGGNAGTAVWQGDRWKLVTVAALARPDWNPSLSR